MPAHITVNQGGPEVFDLECTVCHTGMNCRARFGPVAGADMAATFTVQHTVHTAKGAPAGLTPGGSLSKAARRYIEEHR